MRLLAITILFFMLLDTMLLQTLAHQGKSVNLFDPSLPVSFLRPVCLGDTS